MRRLLAFLTAVVLILEPLAAQAAPLQQLGEEVMGVQGRILASEELPTEEYEDTQEPVVPDTGTQDQAIESSAPGTADPSGSEETPAEGSGAPEAGMPAEGSSMGISAPSAILMEASTGTVIAEKNAHQQRPPASVTKIMTLLLIFDNLGTGKIKLEDSVMTSAYAASMGGSQVFLEEGETQTVDTMIKCISVASANDASVAMAELCL